MKLKMVCLTFWASFLIGYLPAHAADAPYNFQAVDISIPGRPDATVWLKDINNKGQILAQTFWMEGNSQVWGSLIGKLNARQNKLNQVEIFFTCSGVRINDKGTIVGQAADGACVRRPNGNVLVLTGVPQGVGFGISTDNRVSGTFCVPNGPPNFGCTGHGFTWKDGIYTTIDLVGAPGINIRIAPLAPNNLNQLLIDYFVQNEINETSEHGICIYDNGSCQTIALSFEFIGGPAVFIPDFNDEGQAIALRSNTAAPVSLQLYDEGFLDITGLPAGWLLSSLEGMNNEAAFVGAYRIQIGTDFRGTPIFERHDFIATPVRAAKR